MGFRKTFQEQKLKPEYKVSKRHIYLEGSRQQIVLQNENFSNIDAQ